MRASYRARLWNAVIPVDTNFRLASLKGLPVSHMPGKCRGAAAYEMLARVIAPVTIHNEQEFAA
ncbi:MAG: septum site-determining protein MinD [Gammaproteobacteria bacterium]|nr:septum site-determining protein MinD [Gammaproteobacteria bacterium]NIR94050.1 septum site-determining protein MinD [Gammaproteobacteria bacterium]NIW45124.1 hypothetical protein [Gammaproteobacteria bacterium]NIX56355.1 hypothetical protein [candidate division Zixibacteria bacterium]